MLKVNESSEKVIVINDNGKIFGTHASIPQLKSAGFALEKVTEPAMITYRVNYR
jgi:hypothetical protein